MLTAKQEKFVQNILEGMNQADAYRSAYPNQRMSDKTVWETASKLMNNHKVITRLKELRDKLANEKIMSAQKRLEWLTELVGDNITPTDHKLRAIDIMNKMTGEYVQKVQAEVQAETTINIELVDDE
jgi:phage terminase small subunit